MSKPTTSSSVIASGGSCMDDYEGALRVDAAREKILAQVTPISAYQHLALRQCLGRVLAEDILSPHDVPNQTNSAMDGYALRGADLPENEQKEFTIVGTALAGQPYAGTCPPGAAVRIMTGAALPDGTDTVIMQERTEDAGPERVRIGSGHKPGQHTRKAGEDIQRGARVLVAGHRLSAADLGVLASLGIGELKVRRKPRVVFFSTGDELRSIGELLSPGEVYDSNRYTLYSLLRDLDVELHDLGVVRDDPEALRRAFTAAMAMGDVVVTSGGVSVGQADHIKTVIEELGSIDFWKIAIKPGRPLAFGRLGQALFFGLPGNPVAVMVTFQQFVAYALHYLATGRPFQPLLFKARAETRLRKLPGRYEFQRGILRYDADGEPVVSVTGAQGSGILTSMSRANCFILLPEEHGPVEPGDWVQVQVFPRCAAFGLA